MGVISERVGFVVDTEAVETGDALGKTPPFRILILGNFSGRDQASAAWRTSKPVKVDRDDIDRVLAKFRPKLVLETGTGEGPVSLEFKEIDDFDPDKIHQRVGLFDTLKNTRERLAPSTVQASPAETSAAPPADGGGSLLDMILGATAASPVARARPKSPLEAFFEEVGAEHAIRGEEPANAALRGGVDSALGRLMASILHHPRFQALEASWRQVDRLTKRLDTDATLTISLFDVTKEELAVDFAESDDLRSSTLHRLLVQPTVEMPGGQPWGVIVGDLTFGPTQEDVVLLGYLGLIAKAAGAPFVAGASPEILGCASLAETPEPRLWKRDPSDAGQAAFDALRTLPVAEWLGLALPRPLVRLPYGTDDRPIDAFDFDELASTASTAGHERYLWGNPAYLVAELLGRSFREEEWDFSPGSMTEVMGLPLHVDRSGDEPELLPCAEVLLGQRGVEAILDQGLMPMLSYPGRDVVRVARFQSIAAPNAALAGRWR